MSKEKLQVVGNGFYPDVYTYHLIVLTLTLLNNLKRTELTFKVTNLLDDRESKFIGFNEEQNILVFDI